jgi:hypothetical protein
VAACRRAMTSSWPQEPHTAFCPSAGRRLVEDGLGRARSVTMSSLTQQLAALKQANAAYIPGV